MKKKGTINLPWRSPTANGQQTTGTVVVPRLSAKTREAVRVADQVRARLAAKAVRLQLG
jgi:hypothetical protein